MMKMNVTVKMRMPGAGDMPAQTTGQFAGMCGDRGMRDAAAAEALRRQRLPAGGDAVSRHATCGGDPPMTAGDARFELPPAATSAAVSMRTAAPVATACSWARRMRANVPVAATTPGASRNIERMRRGAWAGRPWPRDGRAPAWARLLRAWACLSAGRDRSGRLRRIRDERVAQAPPGRNGDELFGAA